MSKAMGLPWRILREMKSSSEAYRIAGDSKDYSIGVYGSRAEVEMIIEAVNSYEKLKYENARYREALEFIESQWNGQAGDIAREALKGGR